MRVPSDNDFGERHRPVQSCSRGLVAALFLGCSTAASPAPYRASGDPPRHDASVSDTATPHDGSADRYAAPEAGADAARDAALPSTALVRLANWSPDTPGVDFCLAEHGSLVWTGPLLLQSLGAGVLDLVTVAGATPAEAGPRPDAPLMHDAEHDTGETGRDATSEAAEQPISGGVLFPGISPYVSISPGEYDVRVVVGGASDCLMPLFDAVTDLAPFLAGGHTTFATVGDLNDKGTDPAITLVALPDDTRIANGRARLRFVNAVPGATNVSLVALDAQLSPLISATFGAVGIDTDAGALDSNDYVSITPVEHATWFVLDYRGMNPILVSAYDVNVPDGILATVAAIGGESGTTATAAGLLLCVDRPPIDVGESASCTLLGGSPGCPACQ